jgi:hypothetical protein
LFLKQIKIGYLKIDLEPGEELKEFLREYGRPGAIKASVEIALDIIP